MYESPLREVSWIPRTAFQGVEKNSFNMHPLCGLVQARFPPTPVKEIVERVGQFTLLIGMQAGKWKLLTFKYVLDTKNWAQIFTYYFQEIINTERLKSLI